MSNIANITKAFVAQTSSESYGSFLPFLCQSQLQYYVSSAKKMILTPELSTSNSSGRYLTIWWSFLALLSTFPFWPHSIFGAIAASYICLFCRFLCVAWPVVTNTFSHSLSPKSRSSSPSPPLQLYPNSGNSGFLNHWIVSELWSKTTYLSSMEQIVYQKKLNIRGKAA